MLLHVRSRAMDLFEFDQRNSVRVLDSPKNPPTCAHGPMLLFERNGQQRFFSCSAYRDRKLCSAYLSETEWEGSKKNSLLSQCDVFLETSQRLDVVRRNILPQVRILPECKRNYCKKCGELFVDSGNHKGHDVIRGISDNLLNSPPKLLPPLDHSKKEAQFFFSDATIQLILSLLREINANDLLCIACPTIYDEMKRNHSSNCLMLDLDVRFRQFYDHGEYLLFNMFNMHFFEDGAEKTFEKFLQQAKKGLALVVDPPFGGKVEVLARTLKTINEKYHQFVGDVTKDISVFLISPYFMEPQIKASLPNFQMMDYKVDYVNHAQFQSGPKGRKQGSPVRIFTNVPLNRLSLPVDEGYRFCRLCDRWISPENRHCDHCGSCTSKDGRTYVHCHLCGRCVKPTWSHCSRCNRCALADHPCDKFRQKSAVQQSRDVLERCGSERKRKADELVAKSTSQWKVTWKNKN